MLNALWRLDYTDLAARELTHPSKSIHPHTVQWSPTLHPMAWSARIFLLFVSHNDERRRTLVGTPKGAVISLLLTKVVYGIPLTSQNFMACGAPTINVLPDQSLPCLLFGLSLDRSIFRKTNCFGVCDLCVSQVHMHPIIRYGSACKVLWVVFKMPLGFLWKSATRTLAGRSLPGLGVPHHTGRALN